MKWLLVLVLVSGCARDTLSPLPADYLVWESSRTLVGETPGHGDTVRIVYANEEATSYFGIYAYPEGSTLIKEVFENDNGQPGDLLVIEVMTRTVPLTLMESGKELYDLRMGWEFGAAYSRDGEVTENSDFCWRRCHANAPIAGAWFNYAPPMP